MSAERLLLFDTSLRDGAQTDGVDFTLSDKHTVAGMLDALGVDYIEGGYPGANPLDSAFFDSPPRLQNARLTAFGMTKRAGRSAENDPALAAVISSSAQAICLVAKAWDYHVALALGISGPENLTNISESVRAIRQANKEALIDCEHFFDGYKANPEYARACAEAAFEAGAEWIILCDTNGGSMPDEIEQIVSDLKLHLPDAKFGIHAHNDTGQAVANSLAAVRAGARQIQGTLNGLGERCGNADLISLIPTLLLKAPYASHFSIGVGAEALAEITATSHRFDELLNRASDRHAPYVGATAFTTKAGIHASAILKNPDTYEHIAPDQVGNRRRLLVSSQAGKSNLRSELERLGLPIGANESQLDELLRVVKEREARGYAYEAAAASFELLARQILGEARDFFTVLNYSVRVEQRHNALGACVNMSEAVVKVEIDGQVYMSVAEGNGPVNALDHALRKDLGKYQSEISDLRLVDYRVRILDRGTAAVTRVLIESADGQDNRWSTVGVSENIVDASFAALTDSIRYKLLRS